jgi:hypoxanthine phosphoribosyltransferase
VIGDVLFDATAIAARVEELGAQISRDYAGKRPLLIGVLNAAATFLSDLSRAVAIPCELDVIAVTKFDPGAGIRIQKDTSASVEGRHVVLVDDTIDTGMTLQYIVRTLRSRQPASLAVCALLDRPARRIADIEVNYRGFEIPDVYVVGYGLDFHGRYRELPALHSHGVWP